MAPEPTAQPPAPARRAVTLGGVCWILTLVFFVGQGVAQAAWRTPYSLLTNSISDLGNTACGFWPRGLPRQAASLGLRATYICSPQHAVMNVCFIVTGALILLGAFLTRSQWPRRRLSAWGVALLAAAGVGKIIVGLAPENTVILLHLLGALGIPCAVIGILLLGLATWHTRRGLALTSLVLAAVALLGAIGTKIAAGGIHDLGLAERLMDYPTFVWLIIIGLVFVLAPRRTLATTASKPSASVEASPQA
jgi:hypothetical membrane protein